MKKIISLLLTIVLVMLSFPVYASDNTIMPRYLYIDQITDDFSINTGTGVADVDADIMVENNLYCRVVAKIQRKINNSWVNFRTFYDADYGFAYIAETTSLAKCYSYRCVFTYYVYNANNVIIEEKSITSPTIDYR